MLADSDIAEFKKLYKEKFNIELDDITARQKLSLLVRQMEIIYQPITEQQVEELRKCDAEDLAKLIFDVYEAEQRIKIRSKKST